MNRGSVASSTKTVSSSSPILDSTVYLPVLYNTPTNFVAGKVGYHVKKWQQITSDAWILSNLQGYRIELLSRPVQTCIPKLRNFSDKETTVITTEIDKLLNKGVVERIDFASVRYLSNIFTRKKRDGSIRVIFSTFMCSMHMWYITILK